MDSTGLEISSLPATAWSLPSESNLESLFRLAETSDEVKNFFGFRVGGFGFLVPVVTYCEVLKKTQVNPLPNTQAWFNGLVNLRGNLVPVMDLKLFFGEGKSDPKTQRLFAIGKGDGAVGLWIDGLPEVRSINEPTRVEIPPLPVLLERYVVTAYSLQGQLWLNLQYDGFFKALGSQIALK